MAFVQANQASWRDVTLGFGAGLGKRGKGGGNGVGLNIRPIEGGSIQACSESTRFSPPEIDW